MSQINHVLLNWFKYPSINQISAVINNPTQSQGEVVSLSPSCGRDRYWRCLTRYCFSRSRVRITSQRISVAVISPVNRRRISSEYQHFPRRYQLWPRGRKKLCVGGVCLSTRSRLEFLVNLSAVRGLTQDSPQKRCDINLWVNLWINSSASASRLN